MSLFQAIVSSMEELPGQLQSPAQKHHVIKHQSHTSFISSDTFDSLKIWRQPTEFVFKIAYTIQISYTPTFYLATSSFASHFLYPTHNQQGNNFLFPPLF